MHILNSKNILIKLFNVKYFINIFKIKKINIYYFNILKKIYININNNINKYKNKFISLKY